MKRTIQYGVDSDTGLVVSRVGSEVAWPVLNYDAMIPDNNFAAHYHLERFALLAVASGIRAAIRWTRNVPISIKNRHREFWGMRLLPEGPK